MQVAPELSAVAAIVDGGLIGPLRLHANDARSPTSRARQVGASQAPSASTFPARADGFGGRVITGVARDEVNNRLTPVALAIPAPLVVDFHLQWRASSAQRFERPLLRAVGG